MFVDCGAAPFNFDKKNDLNYFVQTITPQGEQRIYWGKDLPRALEEAEAKVGESITATRVASKPVTVEEIQEQPDGSRQTVRVDAKRNSWQVDNHGVNREALTRAYDVLVKSPVAARGDREHDHRLGVGDRLRSRPARGLRSILDPNIGERHDFRPLHSRF